MQHNPTFTDTAGHLAQIAALEAELAFYAYKYGLTDGARRLLARRLQEVGSPTTDR